MRLVGPPLSMPSMASFMAFAPPVGDWLHVTCMLLSTRTNESAFPVGEVDTNS